MEKIIMLGTGHAMTIKYYNTCFLINDNSENILVDGGGGNGILNKLSEADISIQNIHNIIATHEHTDHLFGVIWMIRYISYQMLEGNYVGNLNIFSHSRLIGIIKTFCSMILRPVENDLIGKKIILNTVENADTIDIVGYPVTFFDIYSTKASQYGFNLILNNGKKLTCLGDEPYNPKCHKYLVGTNILTAEAFCMYRDKHIYRPKRFHHSTVKDACDVANHFDVETLILYHTEDDTYPNRKEKYTLEAKKYFKRNIFIPEDLEQIAL